MRFSIKGPIRDTIAFGKHLGERKRVFARAAAQPLPKGRMNALAERLHPRRQDLMISDVTVEFPGTITYRLEPLDGARVAGFRAGQYIAVESSVNGNQVSRPLSIASAPEEACTENAYIVSLKLTPDGYVAGTKTHEWKAGTRLACSEPEGQFTYEPLRDAKTLVCLAGGTGITPFRSIITDSLVRYPDINIRLIHGVNTMNEVLYRGHFASLAAENPERFVYTIIPAAESFITAGIIEMAIRANPAATLNALQTAAGETLGDSDGLSISDTALPDASFFVCGPEAMQDHLTTELARFDLPRRRVRRENFGTSAIDGGILYRAGSRGAPAAFEAPANTDREPTIVVHAAPGAPVDEPAPVSENGDAEGYEQATDAVVIPARRDETILTALERAGLNPPARCRSGECGWCRSKLIAGTVRVRERSDGRRAADRKFSYIHPCAAYPVTDVEIRAVRNPLGGIQQ